MCLTKTQIAQQWHVTDIGEPTQIIGIEITRGFDSISISQKKYIEKVLDKEGMTYTNPVAIPLDPKIPIEPNPEISERNRSNPFARLLGELQYIANATRPDISFAVNRLASYTANPSLVHYGMLKQILRYLAGIKNWGITYKKWRHESPIIAYSDSTHANTDQKKSTSGIVFLSGGSAVSWKSKQQTITALLPTKAEYIALSRTGQDAWWISNIYNKLELSFSDPITICSDSLGAIANCKNLYITHSSRHIDLKWHAVRDFLRHNIIAPESCHNANQMADMLTKTLARLKFKKCCIEMSLVPVWRGVLRGYIQPAARPPCHLHTYPR